MSGQQETVPVHQEDLNTETPADAAISSEYLTVPEWAEYGDVTSTSNISHPGIYRANTSYIYL